MHLVYFLQIKLGSNQDVAVVILAVKMAIIFQDHIIYIYTNTQTEKYKNIKHKNSQNFSTTWVDLVSNVN